MWRPLAGVGVVSLFTALTFSQSPRIPDALFVSTPHPVVDRMLQLADVRPGEVVYDLGCGDGRICVAAAKKFRVKAFGFDIDPERVRESIDNVKKAGIADLVRIEERDIFDLDLRNADVVTLYLIRPMIAKLIPQLDKLKPGSRIVAHDYPIDGVRPKSEERINVEKGREHVIYLYVTPLEKALPKKTGP